MTVCAGDLMTVCAGDLMTVWAGAARAWRSAMALESSGRAHAAGS
jgi:hypothetical protein